MTTDNLLPDDIEIILPERVSDRISDGLCDLTEALSKEGADIASGFLGGAFGYGAHFDNDVFMMHPFCWCEGFDCAWCVPCHCDDDAWRYFLADGSEVDGEAFYAAGGYRTGRAIDVPEKRCRNCAEDRKAAPNFLHKPSGTSARWYKYIGRGMEIELREDWDAVMRQCLASIEVAA